MINDKKERTSLLYGLSQEDSFLAFWKLLFSPSLEKHFGTGKSLDWCDTLIGAFADGDQAAFSAKYSSMKAQIQESSLVPSSSMQNPPWSIISLDMAIGMFPWASPVFDRFLLLLLSTGSVTHKRFGELLPIAFVISGGPGDSKDSAIRICAPSNAARVSAEYWLIRAFLDVREPGAHFTTAPDVNGRQFSLHTYTESSGDGRSVYFDTTSSFGREEEDFRDFLHRK